MKTPIKIILLLCLLCSANGAYAQIVCPPGSKYLQERERGVNAYRERHNADLLEILVDNPPDLDNIFQGCIGRLQDIYETARDLVYGKVGPYNASSVIITILKETARRLAERECAKVVQTAQENYAIISDVIPTGDYWIDFDRYAGNAAGGL